MNIKNLFYFILPFKIKFRVRFSLKLRYPKLDACKVVVFCSLVGSSTCGLIIELFLIFKWNVLEFGLFLRRFGFLTL